jgi:hypothetical protein
LQPVIVDSNLVVTYVTTSIVIVHVVLCIVSFIMF